MKTKVTLSSFSRTSTLTRFMWAIFKLSILFFCCGLFLYARFFYPFHLYFVGATLTYVTVRHVLTCCYAQKAGAGVSILLTIIIVSLSATIGAFNQHTHDEVDAIDSIPRSGKMTFLENAYKTTVFPLYKILFKEIANIKIRNTQFRISDKHIERIQSLIEPGDIVLLRKNNYLSNWIISGFWKHVLLYCGSLDEMDQYFERPSKSALGSTVSEYLFRNVSHSFNARKVSDGLLHSAVVESTSKGVIVQPLEKALKSDYLAVLRPRLPKEKKLSAILYALEQLNKPYDFDFNFFDDNALCCSELIYRAYRSSGGSGLNHGFHLSHGRPVLSPNDFAKDFDRTLISGDCQYDLILYLEGEKASKDCEEKNITAFRASWKKEKGN